MNDQALINVANENNHDLNTMLLFIICLEKRNLANKRNFSDVQKEMLPSQVQINQLVFFGSLRRVKGSLKNAAWNKITVINSTALMNQTPLEV